jgi:hypothetical protein
MRDDSILDLVFASARSYQWADLNGTDRPRGMRRDHGKVDAMRTDRDMRNDIDVDMILSSLDYQRTGISNGDLDGQDEGSKQVEGSPLRDRSISIWQTERSSSTILMRQVALPLALLSLQLRRGAAFSRSQRRSSPYRNPPRRPGPCPPQDLLANGRPRRLSIARHVPQIAYNVCGGFLKIYMRFIILNQRSVLND